MIRVLLTTIVSLSVSATGSQSAINQAPSMNPPLPAANSESAAKVQSVRLALLVKTQDNPWRAKSLKYFIANILQNIDRLQMTIDQDETWPQCQNDMSCYLNYFKQRKIDYIYVAEVKGKFISFGIYATFSNTLIYENTIRLNSSAELTHLRNSTLSAIKILFEHHTLKITAVTARTAELAANSPSRQYQLTNLNSQQFTVVCLSLLSLLIFFVPSCLRYVAAYKQQIRVGIGRVTLIFSTFLIFVPWMAWQLLQNYDLPFDFSTVAARDWLPAFWIENHLWLWAVTTGLLWGVLLILATRFCLPTFQGIERIQRNVMASLFSSWSIKSLTRILCAVIFLRMIVFISNLTLDIFSTPRREYLLIVTPIIALFSVVCFFYLHKNVSRFLDAYLIEGKADENNLWHAPIKRYFIGYLKRMGISFDRNLINRVLFLPSTLDTVVTYGGGFSHSRLCIPKDLLLLAMVEPEPIIEQTVTHERSEDSLLGLTLPTLKRKTSLQHTREYFLKRLKPTTAASIKKRESLREQTLMKSLFFHDSHSEREMTNFNIQHFEHISGLIVPKDHKQSVPLIADNQEDFAVVEELLTEHHSKYHEFHEDDEYDETNPRDLDFLFGIILSEMGRIQRNEHWSHTLISFLAIVSHKMPRFLHAITFIVRGLTAKHLGRFYFPLTDGFSGLNHGYHHLIQYLYYQATDNPLYFTARASADALYKVSKEILDSVQATTLDSNNQHKMLRVMWLGQFLNISIALPKRIIPQFAFAATLLTCVFLYGSKLVFQSIEYHSQFIQVLLQEKQFIESQQQLKQKESTQ